MNLTSAGVMSASLVIGVGAAVTIFDAATSAGLRAGRGAAAPWSLQEDRVADANRGSRRFAPCEKPAKLEHGVCVTDVIAHGRGAPAAAAPQSAPRRRTAAPTRSSAGSRATTSHDEVVDDDDDDDYDDAAPHTRTGRR